LRAIPRRCLVAGCANATTRSRCPEHERRYDQQLRATTPWVSVYKDPRWADLRRQVLAEHPVCQTPGCRAKSKAVDHIVPLRRGGAPFDRGNVQALCWSCHSRKTAAEVAGRPA
jgi:5-methylcytosine-specific restriction protein A